MQSFIICSKRQYTISRNLYGFLFKYNLYKKEIFNTISTNTNFNSQINRLCFPLPNQFAKKHKDLIRIQSLLSKNQFCKIYYFPNLCNARNFSTTSITRQQSPNKSTEDSGKDPKRPNEYDMVVIKGLLFLVLTFSLYSLLFSTDDMLTHRMTWNDFINEILLKGQVKEIEIYPSHVKVVLKPGATYKGRLLFSKLDLYDIPEIKDIEQKIRTIEKHIGIKMEDGIPIRYIKLEGAMAISELMSMLVLLSMFFLLFTHPAIKSKFNILTDLRKAKYTLVDPLAGKGVRFKDVAGLKEAKMEVMEFVDYLRNPERYKKLGAKVPKGALLLGPPGCGKTLLAKAVATESNVPFLSMNGSEFIELVGGVGAARVRNLFAEARKRAPSIIYIDEIDAIGKKRSESYAHFSNGESERTLIQLLVEMDGMTTVENIIILASTNRADVLDKALLRPGRFDRHILIDFPTLEERIQIFEYHLQSLSLIGAEIANVCNEAALHAASEKKAKVDNYDLMYAVDKILGGTIKKSNTLTPPEKKVIVYHEAGHALAAWLLEHVNPLIKVTVVPRTNKRLSFAQYSDSNLKLQSLEHLSERMCVLLGGRVAENIMFNKISTRAQSDLKKATEIAYHQVQQFGMSPSVGLISFNKELTSMRTKKPYSKKLGSLMDAEVRRIITEAYNTTEKLLQNNKDKLITLAEALLKRETLTYKDIEALIGPPPFGKKDLADLEEYNPGVE
ncbi:unnamed protein product [Xylocopa violacea]|uniref:AAA+ ATPase domain-containing protein n=1 Tax=Xylocopa violacea TaxID=135666 RepID=A0ABP1NG57_XYLVO